ncbi:MAG: beta-galactosidase [Anaerolineales bacterium]|nr:beta-galactosidase [Anaerolineales bacterium]
MPTYFETVARPVIAADFDYFRLPREKWELLLVRLRQMGVNALSLSLPWGFHEGEPGAVDLTGASDSRRDVVGLLRLSAALDFVCLLKPGPYLEAGVLGQGLPLWLLRQTDDLEAALPQAVTGWFRALSGALKGQQWPAGPIIALEIKAESGQPQPLSPQLSEVKWPIWLRKHYDGIEALNAAYGTAYRTVNEVKFPENWATAATPVEKDAALFLEAVQNETQSSYRQILLNHGWQVPIYTSTAESAPPWQNFTLTQPADLTALSQAPETASLNLRQPIEADPDPADVGRGPVWAANAPLRADGSPRPTFWQVRQKLWRQTLPELRLEGQTLLAPFSGGMVMTRSSDAALKTDMPPAAKAKAYRLGFTGELSDDETLKLGRGKVSGLYQAETAAGPTDLLLILDNPSTALTDFPLNYLRWLLAAQAQTLARAAELAAALGESLSSAQAEPEQAAVSPRRSSSATLERARQGLSEADAALRKAMASIGALESGFATMLSKEPTQSPVTPPAIIPTIFEGEAKDVLLEVGAACAKIAPVLHGATVTLQRTLAAPSGFTVEQYRQDYATALAAARAAREPLLEVIALLRLEIAAERLPLLAWRVHQQVQELAESLRWGVLRG